jgi:prevent-host-death family protein
VKRDRGSGYPIAEICRDLDAMCLMSHFPAMKVLEIPIRELHSRTGHFVRLAARQNEIIITERGKPAARLSPLIPAAEQTPAATFAQRRRVRADYRAALAGGKLTMPDDSTSALQETAALREL